MTGQDAPGARRPTAGVSSRRALLGKLAALGAGVGAAPRAVASFLGKEPARFELARFSADVTPPLGHPCMGGGIAPAARVEDPLEIHGIVLLGAGEPLVIAAIDWCEIRNDAYTAWRQGLAVAAGTKPERVLLSCVHQHDAPIADLTAQRLLAQAVRPDLFVVTAGYGKCATGYIPTEKAREERDWNLGEWCWVAPGAERPLREAIGRALAR